MSFRIQRFCDDVAFALGWGWMLRALDRVAPRPGIGGPSPRISTATPAEAARIGAIIARHCPDCVHVAALNEQPPIGGRYYCRKHAALFEESV